MTPGSAAPTSEDAVAHREVVRRVVRVAGCLAVAACLTILLVMVLAVPSTEAGPPVLSLTESHGLHLYDVPALMVWACGMVGCGAVALT